MAIEGETYHSFLLRLWQIEQNGAFTWRCSLEETGAAERRNFASLAELMAYLSALTAQDDRSSPGLESIETEENRRSN